MLDLSWVHAELAPHYSHLGRPSIDPVLMIRMLILGYVFAIRSERLPCREAQEPGLPLVSLGLSQDPCLLGLVQTGCGQEPVRSPATVDPAIRHGPCPL